MREANDLTTFMCRMSWKSGSLNLLAPSGPHRACYGTALPFSTVMSEAVNVYVEIKCQLDATDDIYCRFYCMLNMFRAILCPSSGAREYYTDGRCSSLQTGHITSSSTPYRQPENESTKYHRQRPPV